MSSKGQVVIPEAIRTRLGLKSGAQFVVVGTGDAVILKTIPPLALAEFGPLLAQARQQARAVGLKPRDVARAVARVRSPA
jgi:AbrB family looped-hinge helix DNA binding protein